MATWNSSKWMLDRPAWSPDQMSFAQVIQHLQKDAEVTRIWSLICMQMSGHVKRLKPAFWSFALELCPETWAKERAVRLHVHAGLEWSTRTTITSAADLILDGSHAYRNENSKAVSRATNLSSLGGGNRQYICRTPLLPFGSQEVQGLG